MKIYINCPGCTNDLEFDVVSIEEDHIWNRNQIDIKLNNKTCNCNLSEFSSYIKQQIIEEFEYTNQENYEYYNNHEMFS